MKNINKVFDGITYFVAAVAGISLFIAGIGVMNVMYISVTERTEEIAIRRAFGAKARDIEVQFLVESVVLLCDWRYHRSNHRHTCRKSSRCSNTRLY